MITRPHNALFKAVFEAPAVAAPLLRELLPPSVQVAVAWNTLAGKDGSFVDARLVDRHSDLVFNARLRIGKADRVYFVLEHQSKLDPTMPLRMATYQNRIWDRFLKEHSRAGTRLPPVIAVLVSHAPGGWTAPRALEDMFDPAVMARPELAALLPRCSVIVEDLTRMTDQDLLARPLGAFSKLALWLLRDARNPVGLVNSFDFWIPSMLEVGRARSGRDRLNVLITYMFEVVGPVMRNELRAKIQQLGTRSEKVAMTIAQYLRREGRKKGLEEGRKKGIEEGVRQGRINTLRSLLVFKFGTLDAAHEARLHAATPEGIDRYFKRLLTASSTAAVFGVSARNAHARAARRGRLSATRGKRIDQRRQ